MKARWFVLASFLILLGGGLQRVLPTHALLQRDAGPPRLLGVDAYFHVRMAQYTATHFPSQLRDDGGAFFPSIRGQRVSGLFNVLQAAVVKADVLLSGSSIRVAAYRTGAWLPPALALITLALLVSFVSQLADRVTGLWAGACLILYPGTYLARSVYGFLDQHVWESLLALAAAYGLFQCIRSRGRWSVALWAALPAAAFPLSWLGAPVYFLHYALFAVALLAASAADRDELTVAGQSMLSFFITAGVLYSAVIVLAPGIGLKMSPNFPFPIGLAFAILGVGSWLAARILLSTSLRPSRRPFAVVIVAVVGAVFLFLAVPSFRDNVLRAFRVQAPDVTEIDVTLPSLLYLFGPLVLLSTLGWLYHLRRGSAAMRALTVFATVTVVLWLTSGDFDYVPPVFIALYAGVGLSQVTRLRLSRGRNRMLLVTVVILFLAWPWSGGKNPLSIAGSRESIVLYDEAWYQAMEWLSDNSPEPARKYNTPLRSAQDIPGDAKDYGVLSTWLYGNAIIELAGRSPAFARFPSARAAAWLLSRTPQEERRRRCPRCRAGQENLYAVTDASYPAEGYLMAVMRRQDLLSIPEVDRALASGHTHPRFDSLYAATLGVRLVISPDSVEGMHQVYHSSQQSVLFYVYDRARDRLERKVASLKPGWIPPWKDSTSPLPPFEVGNRSFYDIDTVSTVQIFRLES